MGNAPLEALGGDLVRRFPAERDGESEIIQSKLTDDIVSFIDEDVRTLYTAMSRAVERNPNNNCLGWRENDGPYRWLSYAETFDLAKKTGAGLVHLGLEPHQSLVGIYSKNTPFWSIVEHASNAYSFTLVPLYDTLGPEARSYIVAEAELGTIFVTKERIENILEDEHPVVKILIQLDGKVSDATRARAEEIGVDIYSLAEVQQFGADNELEPQPPQPEETATICYTSGTTGNPKGVILTHTNFIAAVAAANFAGINISEDDVHISYLPLAHVFERLVSTLVFYAGGQVGFFRGDVQQLFDDIAELRPTIFPSVPRLYGRLYDKIMMAVKQGGLKQTLFEKALASKLEGLKEGYVHHAIWDKLVFNKIKAKLGGRVRLMITGSAPINPNILDFLRVCFCCPVLEGYGQTETSAAATITHMGDLTSGHVGLPVPCIRIKLVDIPEMDYLATDTPNPRGEICFFGDCNTKGYYKNEEKTAELIDEHGWLHSGDVGELLPDGKIKIIDRKKNLFKLSQGEYVAPEKLELIYGKSKYALQIFVHGNSLESRLVAIIVPDPEVAASWAAENGASADITELCNNEEFIKAIKADIAAAGREAKVLGFERISEVHLHPDQFTPEDILTPTMKLKRQQAREMFEAEIEAMYEKIHTYAS